MKSKAKSDTPLTTAQRLGSLIKSARDIMRKDKGLNGDLDRLPMLTWILFLKFLDDLEDRGWGGPRGGFIGWGLEDAVQLQAVAGGYSDETDKQ